jgi:hypothetical protein
LREVDATPKYRTPHEAPKTIQSPENFGWSVGGFWTITVPKHRTPYPSPAWGLVIETLTLPPLAIATIPLELAVTLNQRVWGKSFALVLALGHTGLSSQQGCRFRIKGFCPFLFSLKTAEGIECT